MSVNVEQIDSETKEEVSEKPSSTTDAFPISIYCHVSRIIILIFINNNNNFETFIIYLNHLECVGVRTRIFSIVCPIGGAFLVIWCNNGGEF